MSTLDHVAGVPADRLEAVDSVLRRYPQLTDNGMGGDHDHPIVWEEVAAASGWIEARCSKTKNINPEAGSSYGLKHVLERETGEYVTNGAFIMAALLLGYRIDSSREVSPFLNIKVAK